MIRKTVLLLMLAAFAAAASQALSQNLGTSGPTLPAAAKPPATSDGKAESKLDKLDGKLPPAEKALPSGADKGLPKTDKSAPPGPTLLPAPGDSSKSSASQPKLGEAFGAAPKAPALPGPGAGKSVPASSASKEGSSSKGLPASSALATSSSLPSPSAGRKLFVDRAVVTLISDNLVPASEPGMLTDLNVEEGQTIEKGAVLARIDSRSTIAKQKVALGEMKAARAQAENTAEIEVAEKAVGVAQAELDDANEIRGKNKGAISEAEIRKNVFNLEKSHAQVKQATNEKRIAELTAEAKQAQYDAASIELDLREVRAPFSGQVVEISKRVGDWVTPGEAIMHIVGLDKVRVRGFVSVGGPSGASHEDVFGKPVTVAVDLVGGKKHTVEGVIGFASPVIVGVGSSREFKVWVDIENAKTIDPATGHEVWKITPGSVATMTIDLTKPAQPVAAGKSELAKGGKSAGKVQAFKPVTSRER